MAVQEHFLLPVSAGVVITSLKNRESHLQTQELDQTLGRVEHVA
jgi:hypothetical protein